MHIKHLGLLIAGLTVAMTGKAITQSVPSVAFTIQNPTHSIAKTRVYTMMGQEVAELTAQSTSRFVWDGKDVDEQDVPPGLYVVQIHSGDAFWHGPILVNR
jgi:hypothetical protein